MDVFVIFAIKDVLRDYAALPLFAHFSVCGRTSKKGASTEVFRQT